MKGSSTPPAPAAPSSRFPAPGRLRARALGALCLSAALASPALASQLRETFPDPASLDERFVAGWGGEYSFSPKSLDAQGGSLQLEGKMNIEMRGPVPTTNGGAFRLHLGTSVSEPMIGIRLMFQSDEKSNTGLGFNADYNPQTDQFTIYGRVGGQHDTTDTLSIANGGEIVGAYLYDREANTGTVALSDGSRTIEYSGFDLGPAFAKNLVFVTSGTVQTEDESFPEGMILIDGLELNLVDIPEPGAAGLWVGLSAALALSARRRR